MNTQGSHGHGVLVSCPPEQPSEAPCPLHSEGWSLFIAGAHTFWEGDGPCFQLTPSETFG